MLCSMEELCSRKESSGESTNKGPEDNAPRSQEEAKQQADGCPPNHSLVTSHFFGAPHGKDIIEHSDHNSNYSKDDNGQPGDIILCGGDELQHQQTTPAHRYTRQDRGHCANCSHNQ